MRGILQRYGFAAAILAGTLLRLLLPLRGYNQDMVFWKHFAEVALGPGSVYHDTVHPYGPVWIWLLSGLESFRQAWLPRSPFFPLFPLFLPKSYATYDLHFLVLIPLVLADLATTAMLARRYGRRTAAFFYCNPCTIYITGFHSQIEGLALAWGLLAMLLLTPRQTLTAKRVIAAGVCLGISLAVKHVLLIFPGLLLLFGIAIPLRARIAVGLIAALTFLAALIPYATNLTEAEFLFCKIFLYSGDIGTGLLSQPLNLANDAFGWHWQSSTLAVTAIKFVFLALVIAAVASVRKAEPLDLFFVYLVALTALSPSVADQYFVIPMMALARFHRLPIAWIYSLLSLLLYPTYMLTEKMLAAAGFARFAERWPAFLERLHVGTWWLLQACLLIALLQILSHLSRESAALRQREP